MPSFFILYLKEIAKGDHACAYRTHIVMIPVYLSCSLVTSTMLERRRI